MENGQNRAANQARLHAIIPAGGAGTRLWPLSRANHPKFLLDILGRGRTLLEATILRLEPLSESITIVTGADHARAVGAQVEGLRGEGAVRPALDIHIIVEPSARDSMPAIGLAMSLIAKRYGADVVVGSFAADHAMDDEELFQEVVRQAILGATSDYITTIGIEPDSPSTAYGYIQALPDEVVPDVYQVAKFVEKPPALVAKKYMEDGFLWNAGMFVMKCSVALGYLRELHEPLWKALEDIAEAWDEPTEVATVATLWNNIMPIAIDHALAEPVAALGGIAVVRAPQGVGWSDVGDMNALAHMTDPPSFPNLIELDAKVGFVSVPEGKVLAVIGIDDAVVVDTADVLLVSTTRHAQRVKEVVDVLRGVGRVDLV